MEEREKVAWLHRRLGFGVMPGLLDEHESLGAAAVLDLLVDPDGHAQPVAPDPWAGVDLAGADAEPEALRTARRAAITAWVTAMVTTPRPTHEWLRWFWHGHLVSSLDVVKYPSALVRQLRLYADLGWGDTPTLVRAMSVDAAMLRYLDGVSNTRDAVNENFGRELLELFTLGVGAFDEVDVRAGATALTGWTIDRTTFEVRFAERAHDDTPQRYLGVDGVHDLDTVVAAIAVQPAHARFLTRVLAAEILGDGVDPAVIAARSAEFAASGLDVRILVRGLAADGLDGAGSTKVLAPVPWAVGLARASGLEVDAPLLGVVGRTLIASGQLPMLPPNVGGWPAGGAWLSTSATLARLNFATWLGAKIPLDGPLGALAVAGDVDAMADALGHPEGWSATTRAALANTTGPPAALLAAAFGAPDLMLA